MEFIRQAINRVRGSLVPEAVVSDLGLTRTPLSAGTDKTSTTRTRFGELTLDPRHLESRRIVAHDVRDPRAKSFDILRTQVLRTMDTSHWQMLAVTSPTPGCGKTVTAVNLALSIARQSDRAVLLVDLDLQKPQVAACLGLTCSTGVLSVVEGETL